MLDFRFAYTYLPYLITYLLYCIHDPAGIQYSKLNEKTSMNENFAEVHNTFLCYYYISALCEQSKSDC